MMNISSLLLSNDDDDDDDVGEMTIANWFNPMPTQWSFMFLMLEDEDDVQSSLSLLDNTELFVELSEWMVHLQLSILSLF